IKASIRDDDPVLYLEHKWLYRRIKERLPEGEEILTPIGQARMAREGKHLSIISYGATLWKSLEAADKLDKEDGVSVEVLDLRTLLPLDDAAIVATVKKTNKVLIVHEDTRTGGIAGEIAARINEQAFEWLDGPIMRVTAHDVPLPYAPTLVAVLETEAGATAAKPTAASAPLKPEPPKAAAPALAPKPEPPKAPAPAPAAPAPVLKSDGDGGVQTAEQRLRTKSTPLVRKIAAEHSVDISRIPGSGYAGRVTKQDILGYIERTPTQA